MAGLPDPRPERVRRLDSRGLSRLHQQVLARDGYQCVLCPAIFGLTHHHIVPRAQGHDVEDNLVTLCGSGTTGCHGKIEARSHDARERLRGWIDRGHPSVRDYVIIRMGAAWFDRHYPRATRRRTKDDLDVVTAKLQRAARSVPQGYPGELRRRDAIKQLLHDKHAIEAELAGAEEAAAELSESHDPLEAA